MFRFLIREVAVDIRAEERVVEVLENFFKKAGAHGGKVEDNREREQADG